MLDKRCYDHNNVLLGLIFFKQRHFKYERDEHVLCAAMSQVKEGQFLENINFNAHYSQNTKSNEMISTLRTFML